MKKLGLLLIFFSLNSAAEFQSPEDLVTPDKPITVIFKNLTRHESVMRVVQAIDDSRVVRPFHMVRAARSLIFYEGLFYGDENYLLTRLAEAIRGKLDMQIHHLPDNALELEFSDFNL